MGNEKRLATIEGAYLENKISDDGKYLRPEMLGLRYQSQHIKRGKNICLTAY
ncbi:9088_t:CDS:2 [Entrophospora sp. SA101]|nr:9088_t:CDS:2 [Entrophospora sp. SA101]